MVFYQYKKIADNNNHNSIEDGRNDGSNYDRIEHILQDVDGTKAKAKVALIGTRNKQKKEIFIQNISQDIKRIVWLEVNQV